MELFNERVVKEFWAHALEEYPKEACGLFIDGGSSYVPMKNHHASPKNNFRMDDIEFLKYLQPGRIAALMHSHTWHSPEWNNYPSHMDMEAQDNMGLPWGIVHISPDKDLDGPFYFGDCVPIQPLIGRKFRPSVYDCYTLLRDQYRLERNILLPLFPREGRWWAKKGSDVLKNSFAKAGFEQIDKRQLEKYDVVLDIVNPPKENRTLNHIMIMQERGLILHHLNGRLSRRDPAQTWVKDSSVCLRYMGAK